MKTLRDYINLVENAQRVAEGRFDEPLTGWHIVSRAHGQVVQGTPSFETKDQAQKYLMTRMFANHHDFKVVHTAGVAEGYTPSAGELAKDLRKMSDSDFSKKYSMSKPQANQHYSSSKLKEQGAPENKTDLSQYSTERLKAYVEKVSGGGVPAFGSGAKLKRVQAELKRRESGVAKGSIQNKTQKELAYHQGMDDYENPEVIASNHKSWGKYAQYYIKGWKSAQELEAGSNRDWLERQPERFDDEYDDEQGVAEGSLNEFAPDGFDGGDDDEGFSPEIARMAQEDGFTKGVSLADGATLARAITINHWHSQHGGMYKQYFAKGFKAGRMNKIKHDNERYNLNLKLMKDGSIRRGEQGAAEDQLEETSPDAIEKIEQLVRK